MSEIFVLDACALIDLINKEDGAEIIEDVLKRAQAGNVSIIMNKLNFLEVYYDLYRSYGEEVADKLIRNINKPPIVIHSELSDTVFKEAGRLKASYKISIADSIALGEAIVSGGQLLTSDHHEFDVIEKSENIKFYWIR